jgi:perosamine synthetase
MIKLTELRLDEEAEKLVIEVLRSGQLAQGPLVERFEADFKAIAGTEYAVAVSNGTVSLEAAIRSLNIGPGDEVIIPAFTFIATLNAVLQAGASVRFADISLDTFTIDAAHAESLVNERTKVIMPVHLYGQMADMRKLSAVAQESELALIEDAAQAHGASLDGKPAGSWGIGSFSFYATKNVTTGEGGIISTNDSTTADFLRLYRNQGMRARYQYEIPGSNLRMTDLQAAVGISQLQHLAEWNNRRRSNARILSKGLEGIEGLVTPVEISGGEHVFHQYTIRVTPEAKLNRDQLSAALSEKEIQSGVYYPNTVFNYECFRTDPRLDIGEVPNSVEAARQVLSIPVNQWLTNSELEKIVEVVREELV